MVEPKRLSGHNEAPSRLYACKKRQLPDIDGGRQEKSNKLAKKRTLTEEEPHDSFSLPSQSIKPKRSKNQAETAVNSKIMNRIQDLEKRLYVFAVCRVEWIKYLGKPQKRRHGNKY
jgi:hypothetical protein